MKNNYHPKATFCPFTVFLVICIFWLIPGITTTNAQLEFTTSISDPFGLVHDAPPGHSTSVKLVDIDGDGVLEAFVTKASSNPACCGEIDYYENQGTSANPVFVPADFSSFGIIENSLILPRQFVDIDGDGDYDLTYFQFAASTPVRILRNNGTATEPDFASSFEENPFGITLPESPTQPGDLLDGATPEFVDLDQDGDLDLMYNGHFLGAAPEAFYFAENLSETGDTVFAAPVKNDYGITYPGGNYHQSLFVDTDGDGDPDLFSVIVSSSLFLWHFENTPDLTGRAQFTSGPDYWYPFGSNTPGFYPTFGTFWDFCDDGDLDLICGGPDGIYFWENISGAAGFTYTSDYTNCIFTDESTGNPTDWSWTFGDGATSTEQNPSHTYDEPGEYEVCLTVSVGSECQRTYCEEILIITGVQEVRGYLPVSLSPNPVQDELKLTIQSPTTLEKIFLKAFDAHGKLIFSSQYTSVGQELSQTIDVSQLPRGVYLLKIGLGEQSLVRKFVKQ